MTKMLVIGDTHIKPSNLETNNKLFDLILEECRSRSIKDVVLLGDIYDTKAIIRSEAQNFLISRLRQMSFINFHILVGNHDYENLECMAHALTPLSLLPNVTLYDTPKYCGELRSFFIPYIHHSADFLRVVGSLPSGCQRVFCHQGISGFDLGGGVLDQHGVNPDDLPKAVQFIVGHYHKYQSKDNVMYLGTPFSHSYGEANQLKRLLLIDGDNQEMVNTVGYLPQHYKLRFSEKSGFQIVSGGKTMTQEDEVDSFKLKDSDFIDVTINCRKEESYKYTREFVIEKLGISFINLRIRFEFQDEQRIVRLNETMGLEEMLKKYLQIKERSDLFDKGLEYLKDAIL